MDRVARGRYAYRSGCSTVQWQQKPSWELDTGTVCTCVHLGHIVGYTWNGIPKWYAEIYGLGPVTELYGVFLGQGCGGMVMAKVMTMALEFRRER